MYFIVLRISYIFLCFCDLCILLFFYMELFEYWISLNITVILKSKYCILELKMEFWHKKPFSIRFVHKSRKFSNFEPTFDYIMLRNLRTVRPIFPKIAPKVAQDFKEKSHESLRRGKTFLRNYRAKRRGGVADSAPPFLLGLTLIRPGGGGIHPPLDVSRDNFTEIFFRAPRFRDFFLSSLAQLLMLFS